MKMFSSERAFLEDAYRRLLDGPKGTNVKLNLSLRTPVSRKQLRLGELTTIRRTFLILMFLSKNTNSSGLDVMSPVTVISVSCHSKGAMK